MRVLRGDYEIVMNFSGRTAIAPADGDTVVLATHGTPVLGDEGIELAPFSGALIA